MVQLCLRLTVAPDRVQDAVQTLRVIMRPATMARACAGTMLSAMVENPTVLCYTEDWLTEEALAEELRSPRFTQLLNVMESAVSRPSLEIRVVSEIRGLEFVELQRNV